MTNLKNLVFASASFKTGIFSFIVLGLAGCDGLARLNTKKDAPPEPIVAEDSAGVVTAPESNPLTKIEAPSKEKKLSSPLYEWKGDGRNITRIIINTDEQKARFYSGDEEVGWSTVATGIPKYPTPTGRFQITEKIENKRSNLYGKVYGQGGRVLRSNAKLGRDPIPEGGRFEGADMPFFMRLTDDGVGLHAGPIPNPGQPASHGCIRVPSKMASVLFRHVSNGTDVTIEGKGPSYGDYVAKQRAEAARRAEARRLAEEKRAAEAQKAQQIAEAMPTPQASGLPKPATNAEMPEAHAVAKDAAALADQTLDAANAREAHLREPEVQPEGASAQPAQTMPALAPEAAKPVPPASEPPPTVAAPPKNPPTPADTPQPPAPAQPAPEILEAPAPSPAAAPAKMSDPAPKPDEPTPNPVPANPEPPATPAATPTNSAT